jgi:GxxExxY protein
MTENELAKRFLDIAFKVHTALGPGLLESAYESILCYELEKNNIPFEKQIEVPINYDNRMFSNAFRADLILNKKVIIELKSVESLNDIHKKQLLTYLKLTGLKLGLLINFNEKSLKNGIVRIVNGL